MANQNAIQDDNQFPALTLHSGTSGTAETIRATAQSSGAANTYSKGGEVDFVGTINKINSGTIGIQAVDSPSIDAFGRWRTSGVGNRLDVEFNYTKQPEIIDEVKAGGGSATLVSNTRGVTLANGGTATGDYAGLYSYDVPYTPGNSQLVEITGALDFAGIGGGTAQIFLRSSVSGSVVEDTYDQTAWSENTVLDADWSKTQIFVMDLQSLKVGRLRFYLNRSGVATKVHEITNDNIRSTGYWQLATHPIYWRVYNDATYTYLEVGYGDTNNAVGFRYRITKNASATMTAICGTVKSEGGSTLFDIPGYPRTINNGVTAKTVSTTLIPLLSIRPRTTFNSITNKGMAIPRSFSVQTDNPIRLVLLHNNTLTSASWVNVDINESIMEYDVSASAYGNGHQLYSEYIPTGKNTVGGSAGFLGRVPLWLRRNTDSGILTIAAIRTSSTNASVLVSINWEEIV